MGCWCCRRTSVSQTGSTVLVWGYPCCAPSTQPCTALLPPKAWAERGSRASPGTQLQGAWLGATARPEPNPQQRVSDERGTCLEAKGSCLVGM